MYIYFVYSNFSIFISSIFLWLFEDIKKILQYATLSLLKTEETREIFFFFFLQKTRQFISLIWNIEYDCFTKLKICMYHFNFLIWSKSVLCIYNINFLFDCTNEFCLGASFLSKVSTHTWITNSHCFIQVGNINTRRHLLLRTIFEI